MNTIKRILSAVIALVLAFSAVPFLSVEAEAVGGMVTVGEKYRIDFYAGEGKGSTVKSNEISVTLSVTLPDASQCKFTHSTKTFSGWKIGGFYYDSGDPYSFDVSHGVLDENGVYVVKATATWTADSNVAPSDGKYITGYYKTGKADIADDVEGKNFTKVYSEAYVSEKDGITKDDGFYIVTFPACDFKYKNRKFLGWDVNGTLYAAGDKIATDASFDAIATWSDGRVVVGSGSEDESSSSSSSSGSQSATSSSKPASSSQPASSSKPSSSSSKPSSSSSKPSSSSSSSVSSSEPSSSESSSSVPEVQEPEVEVFEPISLAYTIQGDIPVTGIEFLLKEDVGGNPQLRASALDGNSATDAATAAFIASGDALAAFDFSLVVDGIAYHGNSLGTATFTLNGTQTTASSNYDSYVLAMAHVTNIGDYNGSYYITDGENTYLYTPETDFREAVSNVKLVEEDGINRLVIRSISGLSSFAYQAADNIIVEVNLVPDAYAPSASIDVTSLSPVLLVQLEVGEGSSSGFAIPFWVWIIIGVLVLLIVVLVVLFLINRKNEERRFAESRRHSTGSYSITGFDEE